MNVRIKMLDKNAVVPTYATEYSAGRDLYANNSAVIKPGETVRIGTGFAIETPEGYMTLIFARSGMAAKRGLAPANKVGVIDSDYRGEVLVYLRNDSDKVQVIEKGDRIAQMVVMPVPKVEFTIAEELNDTDRGDGGFGSTGVK